MQHGFNVIDTKTGECANVEKIVREEEWAKGLMYMDIEGFAMLEDGNLILADECGNFAYCPEGRFKVALEEITREELEKDANKSAQAYKFDKVLIVSEKGVYSPKEVCVFAEEMEGENKKYLDYISKDYTSWHAVARAAYYMMQEGCPKWYVLDIVEKTWQVWKKRQEEKIQMETNEVLEGMEAEKEV